MIPATTEIAGEVGAGVGALVDGAPVVDVVGAFVGATVVLGGEEVGDAVVVAGAAVVVALVGAGVVLAAVVGAAVVVGDAVDVELGAVVVVVVVVVGAAVVLSVVVGAEVDAVVGAEVDAVVGALVDDDGAGVGDAGYVIGCPIREECLCGPLFHDPIPKIVRCVEPEEAMFVLDKGVTKTNVAVPELTLVLFKVVTCDEDCDTP